MHLLDGTKLVKIPPFSKEGGEFYICETIFSNQYMPYTHARNYHKKVIGDPQDINFMEKWLAGLNDELQASFLQALNKQNISLEAVLNGNAVLELVENENYPTRQQIYQIDGKPLLQVTQIQNNISIQLL